MTETSREPQTPNLPHTGTIAAFRSTARVSTDRPARYGKQLANHMSRKVTATWDDAAQIGSVEFADGQAPARLSSAGSTLVMDLESADEELLTRFERVLGIHLVKFGRREELEVHWQRTLPDGTLTAGTSQTVSDLKD